MRISAISACCSASLALLRRLFSRSATSSSFTIGHADPPPVEGYVKGTADFPSITSISDAPALHFANTETSLPNTQELECVSNDKPSTSTTLDTWTIPCSGSGTIQHNPSSKSTCNDITFPSIQDDFDNFESTLDTQSREVTKTEECRSVDDFCYSKSQDGEFLGCVKALGDLPTELLLHITDYLDAPSIASLCLCSKTIIFKLGTAFLEVFSRPPDGTPHGDWDEERRPCSKPERCQRYEFLKLLDRDVKHMVLCHYCKILHHAKAAKWLEAGDDSRLPCRLKDRARIFGFQFSQFQMAMKFHRLGLETAHYLTELCTLWEAHTYGNGGNRKFCEARIINSSFYLRTQYRSSKRLEQLSEPRANHLRPCTSIHDSFDLPYYERSVLIKIMRCKMAHHYGEICSFCSGIHQCPRCATEFKVEVESALGPLYTFIITVWQEFGACLTPFDHKWKDHFTSGPAPAKFAPGSIAEAFESFDLSKELL